MTPHEDDQTEPGLIGQSVGNYQLTSLLGKGGMGEVYQARHPMLGREVAVKVISKEFSTSTEAMARFRQEAQLVNQVGHPAIVEITDFGRLPDGRSYYVMPLLRGASLRDHMEQRGALSVAETLTISLPVLEALSAVHRAGIVHRDIKPDNVFLAETPAGTLQPRLLDFGVAKLADESPASVRLTKTGQPIGTPLYMSPEQAMGSHEQVGAWSDVYSFGVMLFHMLSGRPPYDGPSFMSVAMKHVDAPIPSIRSFRPDVSDILDGIIQRCMQKAPVGRFADAAHLGQALLELTRAGTTATVTATAPAPVTPYSPSTPCSPVTPYSPAPTLVPAPPFSPAPSLVTAANPPAAAPAAAHAAAPVAAPNQVIAATPFTEPPPRPQASGSSRSMGKLLALGLGGVAIVAGLVFLGLWLARSPNRPATTKKEPDVAQAPIVSPQDAGTRALNTNNEMVRIPSGCFHRGSTEGDPDEVPVSRVCVSSFELDRLEATVNDYSRCVSAGNCQIPTGHGDGKQGDDEWKWQCNWEAPGRARHPINCITYYQAKAYCLWRGKRLPTEAEWEYAARGPQSHPYPWGKDKPSCARAIVSEGGTGCGAKQTHPVGSRPLGAGPFGALDQIGNVWEWVEDCWEMHFYARSRDTRDPVNRCDGNTLRVIRGGSWMNSEIIKMRSALRGHYRPNSRAQAIGVRCAKGSP